MHVSVLLISSIKCTADQTCLTNINTAIDAMNTGLTGCIGFTKITTKTAAGKDFLWISNTLNNG